VANEWERLKLEPELELEHGLCLCIMCVDVSPLIRAMQQPNALILVK